MKVNAHRMIVSCMLVGMLAATGIQVSAAVRRYETGGLEVRHNSADEGVYFDTPDTEVAYNTIVLRTREDVYHTIYHAGPMKPLWFPGDSLRTGVASAPFDFRMPAMRPYRLWGDVADKQSMMYSALSNQADGCSGAGNPMMIKGNTGDDHYYIYFISVYDDDGDHQGSDFRHYVCEARTLDFVSFELRTEVGGKVCWKPYGHGVPREWRRPKALMDVDGRPIRGQVPITTDRTQGMIGSICRVNGVVYYFYADVDTDGMGSVYYRTCPDPGALDAQWSGATKIPNARVMRESVVRVAKAHKQDRWMVLYNGYKQMPDGSLRQDLFCQYTRNLNVIGPGGLSDLRFFDRFAENGAGIGSHYLGLTSGGGCYAQHFYMTDDDGNLELPDGMPDTWHSGGFITWTDFATRIAGAKIHWATFNLSK